VSKGVGSSREWRRIPVAEEDCGGGRRKRSTAEENDRGGEEAYAEVTHSF
jgi:hypothetical protein